MMRPLLAAFALAAVAIPAGLAAHHGWSWTEDAESRIEGDERGGGGEEAAGHAGTTSPAAGGFRSGGR